MQPSNAYDEFAITWHITSRSTHHDYLIVDMVFSFVWGFVCESHYILNILSTTVYQIYLVVIRMHTALYHEACNSQCIVGLWICDRSIHNELDSRLFMDLT